MTHAVVNFQTTPNPNALKCVLDKPLAGPIRSFRSKAEAAGDPLGSALFAISGVTSVLINGGWMTVNKSPEADWASVKRGVEAVLRTTGDAAHGAA